ncbi:MAG TPA: adenylate/guanylate cyclase domain-containing protein [Cyanobacteria bacterium UBA8803]|nr:adenylate/guanylate cyclase domain-containing protein [Cyanobacteria bacterium UBA9273]HBL62603.1 adenylate/guanylate cyclase domain-containing protein [Cyanobacteria bacterium UBA8803]
MSQLISQVLERLLSLLLKRTVLILSIMFCVAVGVALANMSQLSMKLIESQALQNAAWSTKTINEAINLYSDEAVSRAQKVNGITVTHNYPLKEGAIPLPSTYALELGWRISAKGNGMSVRLYSDYPFPWRKAEGGPRDDFEQEALRYLRQQPNQQFSRLEKNNGNLSLRYAQASIMQSSCVACHNTHPKSPKRDWEVGDVRGVWEVTQPLDSFIAQTESGLRGTSVMLGSLSLLGLSGITLVIGRLRQTAKDLEQRVRERTADLAQANVDLEKRNELIRQVFGRYLSDRIVAQLLESPEGLKLGGERRKITILTSDLRGFTSLSERMQPEEVIHILNLYLEYMADVITSYEGTIDEFMGDGILVLFGAPTARQDDTVRAVACACAMQLAMGAVNERMKQLGLPSLEMGIGINTGEVVVGNIGSEKRTKYGIVGSEVNLTYRIESYTTGGQILISEATLNDTRSVVKIGGQKQVKPKGVKELITIYEVIGIGGFYNLYLPPKAEELFLSVAEEILLQYTILDGKHVSDAIFRGRLVKLSAKGAEIEAEHKEGGFLPPGLSNIKLNLLTPHAPTETSEDIYAKVLEKSAEQGNFYIHFTSLPPVIKERFDILYKLLAPNV